jgi:hypothetical protein
MVLVCPGVENPGATKVLIGVRFIAISELIPNRVSLLLYYSVEEKTFEGAGVGSSK